MRHSEHMVRLQNTRNTQYSLGHLVPRMGEDGMRMGYLVSYGS